MTKVIHVEQTVRAHPDQVFALLADAPGWTSWAPFDQAELEQAAPGPDRGGVGAIRLFRTGRTTSRERVVGYQPGRLLSYELLSGMPLRGYHSEVRLDAVTEGTRLSWHSEFEPQLPGTGWFYRLVLQIFIARCARGLAAAAEVAAPRQV